jgi:hypothetical protein
MYSPEEAENGVGRQHHARVDLQRALAVLAQQLPLAVCVERAPRLLAAGEHGDDAHAEDQREEHCSQGGGAHTPCWSDGMSVRQLWDLSHRAITGGHIVTHLRAQGDIGIATQA